MDVNYYCRNRTFYYPQQNKHIQRNTWKKYSPSADFYLPQNVNSVKKKSLKYLPFWIVSCISLETSSGENSVKVIFLKAVLSVYTKNLLYDKAIGVIIPKEV